MTHRLYINQSPPPQQLWTCTPPPQLHSSPSFDPFVQSGTAPPSLDATRPTSLLDVPREVLELVALFLSNAYQVGVVHELSNFQRVCRRTFEVTTVERWLTVWEATYKDQLTDASQRFSVALASSAPHLSLASAESMRKAFIKQVVTSTVAYHLELGLLPPAPPSWCSSSLAVEKTLCDTLRFCVFQVRTAQLELQCTRGKVPVIESAAVLTSLIHIVIGVLRYLSIPDPPLVITTPPMCCICATWMLYLMAYGLYRVMRATIRKIPDEAAALWQLGGSEVSLSKRGVRGWVYGGVDVFQRLSGDKRFVGALAWTCCLLLSVALWVIEVSRGERATTERILLNVFAPPTFAASLVAWQRSGKKLGLVAGGVVGSLITCIIVLPWLLFLGLGMWSLTALLRIHRVSYRAPRSYSPAHWKLGVLLGNTVILSICVMSASWFVSLALFLKTLLLALVVLSCWVCGGGVS